MNKFQRLQRISPYRSPNSFNNLKNFNNHSNNLFLRNLRRVTANAAESSIVEKGSKDIIRVAAIYAGCGTLASYLDMMYNGKVFVLKWSVPSPERFLLCAFCWGIAGCTSWLLFWSRSEILIRAAAARVRYGVVDGSRTSIMALGVTGVAISLFSIYFDYIDYRTKRSQYIAAMTPSILSDHTGQGIGSTTGVIPPTDRILNDEDEDMFSVENDDLINNDNNNNNEMNSSSTLNSDSNSNNGDNISDSNDKIHDSMILGENASNVLISSDTLRTGIDKIKNKNKNKSKNVGNSRVMNAMNSSSSKPEWNWEKVGTNIYEPCKIFFQCNAPIWLLFGTFTGVFTARIMTHNILMNGMGAMFGTGMVYNACNKENNGNSDESDENEIELLRIRVRE